VYRTLLLAGTALVGTAVPSAAQSLQRWGLQGSGALVFPTAEETDFQNETRLGWEAQVRYTFSRFSLGAGYQRSTVYRFETGDFSAAVSVGFLEPRYVMFAGSVAALYLAGRIGSVSWCATLRRIAWIRTSISRPAAAAGC
jgi:predicted porin